MVSRLAVLLSGRGSNFLALQHTVASGRLPAEIVLVASNVASAAGLAAARDLGLPTVSLPHGDAGSRDEHDRRMVAALREAGAEWVCLAGYMRLLGPRFVQAYPERILNIHPSLLPAFPGLDVHRQALDYGVRVSGCTVHLVDEQLDHGPIVEQRVVPVADDDTEETLAERILEEEHRAYPRALERLLTEAWRVEGRRVVFGRR